MKRKTSQVASELIKRLDTHLNDESIGNPFFPERGIQPFPLTTDGFKTIQNVDSDKKTAFVDGGNQEVLGAPNFSVQLNRVYFGIWSGNKRIPERSIPKQIEFFAATFSDFERGEIQYSTSLFPLAGEEAILPRERDLSFSSMDRSITVGNQRADIYRVGSISRRFSELVLAKSVVENELAPGDVIVLDGTLQTAFPHEYAYLDELSQAAQKKGVILGGLSKTSALFTDTGYSLLGALDKLSAEKGITSEWYYPIADGTSKDHFVFILGVKLNAISERIFRLEIQRVNFCRLTSVSSMSFSRSSCEIRRIIRSLDTRTDSSTPTASRELRVLSESIILPYCARRWQRWASGRNFIGTLRLRTLITS